MSLRMFFSHSYADEPMGAEVSDAKVAKEFREMIREFSNSQIEVVTARDAKAQGIPDHIAQLIDNCDFVFCLFTKRHHDPIGQFWLPSQYVLSESAFAAGRYYTLDPWKRVYGFVEDGVDRSQLGIAFGRGLRLPSFSRTRLRDCENDLRIYIQDILQQQSFERPVIATRVHKKVFVWRDGFVEIKSKYGFLIVDPTEFKEFRRRHVMWRIRRRLPSISDMMASGSTSCIHQPFFHRRLNQCNGQPVSEFSLDVQRIREERKGSEWSFDVVCKVNLRPTRVGR